jgi:hypothetical protein
VKRSTKTPAAGNQPKEPLMQSQAVFIIVLAILIILLLRLF